jgi:hypothetical protein
LEVYVISQDDKEKILSIYAKATTTENIEVHIRDYGIEVSETTVNCIKNGSNAL